MLCIPDVNGLTPAQAAPAYAAAGWYIAPTKPTDYRNPGSYLGKGWPRWTTRDLAKIGRFWAKHPNAGIALHMGRSGAIAADLDVDILTDDLKPLDEGAIQLSRLGGSVRGHRVFATSEKFVSGKLRNQNGQVVGDVRSGNTVIIAAPTSHTKDGQYRWLTTGPVPNLTNEARAFLTLSQEAGAVGMSLTAVLETWSDNQRPHKLEAMVMLHKKLLRNQSPHDAMREALKVGFCEARIGYVPAAKVVATLRQRWDRSPAEFSRLCVWAADIAQATDLDLLKLRSDRAKGSDSRRYSTKLALP
ncbi:bifunctional DNA primase/polymerase [Mycobacterium paraseoulense]|uniref:DNA primase/polymerase bifunctional N-terminal domain-containing protein n=1 Tax=Mycobacterium paraseoulense TaxID=590652 RepID=A0A1X0I4S9_9MYCO|nr:bifunctional DNA primase/polymerase [Mycobacterium paraseoulense]MCV7396023.1 bifunctional DNA primase/polymerase [Mycobacterium paraseoulense]ORB34296.1 hypothetical protein BST39_24410 [Mycobacterium paraseoulense]BBZ70801.1 hypothetical protein MPRS_18940 [Mycobacterium paraseoulense]